MSLRAQASQILDLLAFMSMNIFRPTAKLRLFMYKSSWAPWFNFSTAHALIALYVLSLGTPAKMPALEQILPSRACIS